MPPNPTPAQLATLRALAAECQRQAPQSPSIRDVARHRDPPLTPARVHRHLRALFALGLVGHAPGVARSYRPTDAGWNYCQSETSTING